MSAYTEDHLVEQPAIQLMQHELGWDVMNCFGEWSLLRQGYEGQGGVSDLGREGKREVVLTGRLKAALLSLNPDLPEDHSSPRLRMAGAIDGAVEELSRDRTALSLVEANREIDKLLKGGVHGRINGFQSFRRFHRLVKQAVSLKRPRPDVDSLLSRFRESGKNVKIRLCFTRNRLFMTT